MSTTRRVGDNVKEQLFCILLKLSCYKFNLECYNFRILSVNLHGSHKKIAIEYTYKESKKELKHFATKKSNTKDRDAEKRGNKKSNRAYRKQIAQ